MSKKKAYIIILFFVGLMVSELHQFVQFDGIKRKVDWFIDVPKFPPTLQWYLHDSLLLFRDIMWMWGAVLMGKMIDRRLHDVLLCFLVYLLLDTMLFFICYKQYGYGILYSILGVFTSFIIFKKK